MDNEPKQPKTVSSHNGCPSEPSEIEQQIVADSMFPALDAQDSCLEELNYLLGDIYSQPPSPNSQEGSFFEEKQHECEGTHLVVGSPCLDSKQELDSPSVLQVG